MVNNKEADANIFGSKIVFLMLLVYRIVGIVNSLTIPSAAIQTGAFGTLLLIIVAYIVLGIPLIYMELIVSQFTGRDVIDIWKMRPCVSHVGYFIILWQVVIFIYNHIMSCLLVHYLLRSFQTNSNFYQCGSWSNHECNFLKTNHSLNQFCVKVKQPSIYCTELYQYYPEFQYYTMYLFGEGKTGFYMNWSLCVASIAVTIILFFNCFRRIKSIRFFLYPLSIYPTIAYLVLITGSLRQKGLILHFGDAMDAEFTLIKQISVSRVLSQTMYSVGAGSGIISNLAAVSPFRSPCYSNAVIIVLFAAGFTSLTIIVTAMLTCPYVMEFGTNPLEFMKMPIVFTFVKIPKLLSEYSNKMAWLFFFYSSQCILVITTNIIIYYTLFELAAKRNAKIEKYFAVITLGVLIVLFFITIPALSSFGRNIADSQFEYNLHLGATFFALCENVVFITWYGFDRFYEDIHFMQGIQPRSSIKFSWMVLNIVLLYVFIVEFIDLFNSAKTEVEVYGLYLITTVIISVFVLLFIKLAIAVSKKKFVHQFKIDPSWGPQNEVLRRSRAMFTAHAMTKEYMYRQYHLQAGVVARQMRSNVRQCARNPAFVNL